ncbi:MAG TPA: glycosyltransferase family 39 protein [Candidatus Saccharimonadales bacterium]|nr:glycosyltransferase family 39 protein [Candidatus Saccharimonadales bacterium]
MNLIFPVIIASIFVFFRNISTYPLTNWDEAWYGEIIKNMASGSYQHLMPFWNGSYFFDHSPLYFWLTTIIVKIFGLGEWQVRLISAISATIATVLVFLIGKRLKDQNLGAICALIFLTIGQVVPRFSHGNLDAFLICLFLASFYAYLISEETRLILVTRINLASVLCGISIGLGILVKSWGTGLFPIALIFIYAFFKNRKLPKNSLLIIASALVTFGWWYVWGTLTWGKTFINWYILNPSENGLGSPIQSFSPFYLKTAARDVCLWFLPLASGIVLSVKKTKLKIDPIIASFTLMSVIYIFALNFLYNKSDWYNLPAYPFVAVTIGYFTYAIFKIWPKITLFALIVIAAIQIWNVNRIENIYPDRSKVGADLGKKAKQVIPKGSTVILDDHDLTSFLFYSDQTAIFTIEEGKKDNFSQWWKISHDNLADFTKTHQNVWIVTKNPKQLNLKENYQQIDYINQYYFLKIIKK